MKRRINGIETFARILPKVVSLVKWGSEVDSAEQHVNWHRAYDTGYD